MIASLIFISLCACQENLPETVEAVSEIYTRDIIGYGTVDVSETELVVAEKGAVLQSVEVEKGEMVNEGDLLVTVLSYGVLKEIAAECSGIVSEIETVGTASDGKKPVCVLTKTDTLSLSVLVNEKDIGSVKVGDTVTVSGDGFGNTACEASVERCLSIPEQSGSGVYYRVRIGLPEKLTGMLPGMSAKAVIHATSQEEGIIVPFTSVGFDKEGYYLYLSGGERVDLTSAVACNDGYAVAGIEAGSQVVRYLSEVEK